MPLGCVYVQISRALKLLHIYIYIYIYICVCVLALYVAGFRNYMQSSAVNTVTKDVDFCKCKHSIAGCHL